MSKAMNDTMRRLNTIHTVELSGEQIMNLTDGLNARIRQLEKAKKELDEKWLKHLYPRDVEKEIQELEELNKMLWQIYDC